MIVKLALDVLLLVFAVKSQSLDLFECRFTYSDCGITFGNDGQPWTLSEIDFSSIECVSSEGGEAKCQDILSPSIPQLPDESACLAFEYTNYAETADMQVSMFNSSSSYPVTSFVLDETVNHQDSKIINLPETSYTQFSIALNLGAPGDSNLRKFILHTVFVFQCPRPTTVSTTPETTSPTPVTTTPIPCDLNLDGTCFIYFNKSMSHQQAQETCLSLQGKLPELRSESIKNLLISQVKSTKLKMWIGANDQDEEGSFVWESDNEKLDVPKSWWKRGEPNNWRGKEDCVMMKPPKGKLNDGNCDKKLTFFCQF